MTRFIQIGGNVINVDHIIRLVVDETDARIVIAEDDGDGLLGRAFIYKRDEADAIRDWLENSADVCKII